MKHKSHGECGLKGPWVNVLFCSVYEKEKDLLCFSRLTHRLEPVIARVSATRQRKRVRGATQGVSMDGIHGPSPLLGRCRGEEHRELGDVNSLLLQPPS